MGNKQVNVATYVQDKNVNTMTSAQDKQVITATFVQDKNVNSKTKPSHTKNQSNKQVNKQPTTQTNTHITLHAGLTFTKGSTLHTCSRNTTLRCWSGCNLPHKAQTSVTQRYRASGPEQGRQTAALWTRVREIRRFCAEAAATYPTCATQCHPAPPSVIERQGQRHPASLSVRAGN